MPHFVKEEWKEEKKGEREEKLDMCLCIFTQAWRKVCQATISDFNICYFWVWDCKAEGQSLVLESSGLFDVLEWACYIFK